MRRSVFSVVSSLRTVYRSAILDQTKAIGSTNLLLGVSTATATITSTILYSYSRSELKTPFYWNLNAFEAKADIHHNGLNNLKPLPQLPHISLYQYEVCPFCCKVRAFLDYHKIPYEVVEVNPISKSELKWSNYKKVPVIKLGDEQINDSNTIIATLVEKLKASSSARNSFSVAKAEGHHIATDGTLEEKKWKTWVDERLVRIITANIYRSLSESWETFEYIAEHGNFGVASRFATRMFGTATMYVVGQRMPKKYNIEGDIRQALYLAVNDWVEAVGSKDFLGGNKPNLADLAVFGVIEAVHGTRTFQDMIENTKVKGWHERMTLAVGSSSRTKMLTTPTKANQSHLET